MSINNAGLTTSLNTLVDALKANQNVLSTISDNISNATTTGYTKRTVTQQTIVADGSGVGVNIAQIARSIDNFLVSTYRNQISASANSAVVNTYLDRLQQSAYGSPDSSTTVSSALNSFYSGLDNFSADPSSSVNRTLVQTGAQNFTSTVNTLANNIQQERLNSDADISSTIGNLNTILTNLSSINTAILKSSNVGGDVNSLYDARDLQLKNVKSIINGSLSFNSYGQVSISVANTELLGFGTQFKVDYSPISSLASLNAGVPTNAITVAQLDSNGNETSNVQTLLSASNAANKVDTVPNGQLRGLIDLRDTILTANLNQLDNFAYNFANTFNESYNSGTGYPPPQTLNGTTSTTLDSERKFSGSTRITLLDPNGNPVAGKFGTNIPPLTIDFDKFNDGTGTGNVSTQSLINEINQYYGNQPSQIVNIGSANDIRLAADSTNISSTKASAGIAFTGQPANNNTIVISGETGSSPASTTVTFVTGTPTGNQVKIGADTSETLSNLKDFLNASTDSNISQATYSLQGNSLVGTYKLGGVNGNTFSFNTTGTPSVTTATTTNLSGGVNANGTLVADFDFSNLSTDGTPVKFDVTSLSINGGGATTPAFTEYTQAAGDRQRTGATDSTSRLNIAIPAGLQQGDSFTVTATIKITDSQGNISTQDVTYSVAVPDPATDITNTRYAPASIAPGQDGTLVSATNTNPMLTASLVDANGNPVTDPNTAGFLQIKGANTSYRVSIDQLDSQDQGDPTLPNSTETDQGFSHYFGLNNFFTFGSSATGAATNLQVRSDIANDPSLISSGKAQLTTATGTDAVYTYEIGSGNNLSVIDLQNTENQNINFASTNGIAAISTSATNYVTQIYNYAGSTASSASDKATNDSTLQTSLETKISDVSGVDIDAELANTIQVQNAYSAAAKVLGVLKQLFSALEGSLSSS